jgi:HAE1 family hydrophobic/amphiphilic exporter-1
MKAIFNALTVFSVRFRLLTLVFVIVVLILGGVAATSMNQELIPPIELPQTFILAETGGMTSEQTLKIVKTYRA